MKFVQVAVALCEPNYHEQQGRVVIALDEAGRAWELDSKYDVSKGAHVSFWSPLPPHPEAELSPKVTP